MTNCVTLSNDQVFYTIVDNKYENVSCPSTALLKPMKIIDFHMF